MQCVQYLDMRPVCCVIGVFVGAWFGMAWVGVVGLFGGFLGLLLGSGLRTQPVFEGHVALVPVGVDLLCSAITGKPFVALVWHAQLQPTCPRVRDISECISS